MPWIRLAIVPHVSIDVYMFMDETLPDGYRYRFMNQEH